LLGIAELDQALRPGCVHVNVYQRTQAGAVNIVNCSEIEHKPLGFGNEFANGFLKMLPLLAVLLNSNLQLPKAPVAAAVRRPSRTL